MPARQRKYGSTWGKELLVDLEVPSGSLCQVRRPGITGLIKAGLLDSLDTLTSLVKTEHADRVERGAPTTPTQDDLKALLADKDKLLAALELMDKVICYVVVQPQVLMPIPEDQRDPACIYADSIDLEDKVFIFQYVVGGVSDLETFRQEFGATVASMENVQGVQATAL